MANKIQIRRDTASNWTSSNPTLSQGEQGYETDTGKLKIGDGSTAWTSLGYSFESSGLSNIVEDTTPQLGGDLDVGTHRIETTESQMNFEVDSDASSTGYEGYYFYGGPTTNGYNRIWITGTETALQQRVGSFTAYTAFIQNNNQYSVIINEHGGNHPAKITNWGNGSSAHLNIGVRHADAKVRFTDHTGNTLRYAFPNSTPSSGQVLTASDGSGTLSWATASGSDPDLYRDNASSATTPSATGTNSVAIGSGSSAGQTDSIAIGGTAYVGNSYAVALGYDARVSGGDGGTALGKNARTAGSDSVAVGNSYSSGKDSFAASIDNNTSSYGATGSNSVAIGDRAKATGNYSVSIGRLNTVSGPNGAVGLGQSNTVSGEGAFGAGQTNIASGAYTQALGNTANTANIHGKLAKASGNFNNYADAQLGMFVLRSDTTDATAEALTTNNSTAGTTNQVVLPNNSAYFFSGTCIARQQAADGTDVGAWEFKGAIRREANAGTTTLIKSTIDEFNVPTGWALALSADTTNGCLKIQVTGVAATDIRWVATVHTSEVTYA